MQVLAADPNMVVEATRHLAPGSTVNLFAGLKRGTTTPINGWLVYGPAQVRLIGHSGSGLTDQIAIVERSAAGHLAPERCVSAIGGLRQVPDGLEAMLAATYPGKIVIFPAVPDFPFDRAARPARGAAGRLRQTGRRPDVDGCGGRSLPGSDVACMNTQQPTIVILGVGRIGRGFVADLFAAAGYRLVLVDESAELVAALRAAGR